MREGRWKEGKKDERRKSGGQWAGNGLRGKGQRQAEGGKEKELLSEEQEREDDKR